MQIREIDKDFEDLCSSSINNLETRVRKYLRIHYGIENPWILDAVSGTKSFNSTEEVEVVLFGSYLQKFFETGNWTCERVRFWVLSSSVKNVMINIFKIPCDVINVIRREDIFPLSVEHKEGRVDLSKEITFLYGGRISESKNVEAFLYCCYHLQKNSTLKIKPIISGEFDNMTDIYSMKIDSFSYKDRLLNLVEGLDWAIKPIFRHGLDENEWLEQKDKNCVYINLSTFQGEDFGVSLAQAVMKGLPCIVSGWGGHNDIEQNNVLRVPIDYIEEPSGQNKLIYSRSWELANFISENINTNTNTNTKKQNSLGEVKRNYINIEEIDNLRRNFFKKHGVESMYLARGQFSKYYALEKGERFFSKVKKEFSNSINKKVDVLIIINDLCGKTDNIKEFCNTYALKEFKNKKNVVFLSVYKVLRKSSLTKIIAAEKIVLSFYNESLSDLVTFIDDNKNSHALLEIYCGVENSKKQEFSKEGTLIRDREDFLE